MKLVAVVVTYNRLSMLKKCLAAVSDQSRRPDEVIVVNNGSTDETAQWLSDQTYYIHTQENKGGAGGFSAGISIAYQRGADWTWLMDDDSIPQKDALHQMEAALVRLGSYQNKVGFLSGAVLWTDGSLHEMNKTHLSKDKAKLEEFAFASAAGFPLVQFGTFVSMLLSKTAVEKVGLPIKEFFIWGDDFEYSKRIMNNGLAGLAVKDSITIHETPTNNQSNVFEDPHSSIWKFNHGLRNELFTKRLHEGEGSFWKTWIHRMFIMPFRILLRRRNHRWAYIKLVWKTSLNAIFFKPTIEQVSRATST